LLAQRRRDKAAAVKLMRKLLKKQGFAPEVLVTQAALLPRPSRRSDCRLATTTACARTIGLRIRTSRRDGASARCSASNSRDQPSVFSPFTPLSKTLSTSSAISHPAARSASSERKPSGRGELLPRLNVSSDFQSSSDQNLVRVTRPVSSMLTFLNAAPLRLIKEMAFTAKPICAARAVNAGLINHVSPSDELESFTYAITSDIVANAPLSIAVMKEELRILAGAPSDEPARLGARPGAQAHRLRQRRLCRGPQGVQGEEKACVPG
jgi:hypothetical protein